ncbi:cardiolipin synthase ClsB [Comamonadaceae bacterium M7527]|nr:cardiolipin synthase ClsB [Comamonadaceae bacterium M7527]
MATELGHSVQLLAGGRDLFPAMIKAMANARSKVRLETYIFDFDGDALSVAQALADAARRGLTVQVVLDGVGTPHVPQAWQQRWAQAGVQWRWHAPLGAFGLLIPSRWRRLHRKLCVVDEELAFCGGINVVDDYLDVALGPLLHPRLDFAVQVQGPLVAQVCETMQRQWQRLPIQRLWQGQPRQAAKAVKDRAQVMWRAAAGLIRGKLITNPYAFKRYTPQVSGAAARLVLRDNARHRHDIEKAYLQAIANARTDVWMAMAYFVPGAKIRRAMYAAAARGVAIHVVVQGRYENFMQFRAARPIYKRLAAAGIALAHYSPSALHAKVAVVDGQWATVGSSNLDPLSLLLAKEANIEVSDREFAQDLRDRLQTIWAHSETVTLSLARETGWRGWWERGLDAMAFALMRTALWLTGHTY